MLNGRLLVLDDDLAVAQTIAWIAEETGLETRIACEAVQFFETCDAWQPTHIAIDLVMPDMDGVEVMRMLAIKGCRAQIIITSGVGGLFPAGLPVAKVTSVERDTASGFARAVCEPLAHPERYRHFLVLQVDVERAESNRQEVDSGGSD